MAGGGAMYCFCLRPSIDEDDSVNDGSGVASLRALGAAPATIKSTKSGHDLIQDIPVMGDVDVEEREYGEAGVLVLPSGTTCTGPFLRTGLSGHGSLARADGCSFTGQFFKGRMNGFGQFKWNDGRTYIGQYVANQKEGEGEFIWPDGRSYKGQWCT